MYTFDCNSLNGFPSVNWSRPLLEVEHDIVSDTPVFSPRCLTKHSHYNRTIIVCYFVVYDVCTGLFSQNYFRVLLDPLFSIASLSARDTNDCKNNLWNVFTYKLQIHNESLVGSMVLIRTCLDDIRNWELWKKEHRLYLYRDAFTTPLSLPRLEVCTLFTQLYLTL